MIGAGIMAVVLIVSCIAVSCTDIRYGKIYNRHLTKAFAFGGIGAIIYYWKNQQYIVPFLINITGALILAALFYHFKLWGAGDSKFWLLICLLYPYERYVLQDYLVIPAIYILFFMFIAAYFYVLLETGYFLFRDGRKPRKRTKTVDKDEISRLLINAFFHFFLLKCFYVLCELICREYFWGNYLFFALSGIIVTLYVSGKTVTVRFRKWIAAAGIAWTVSSVLLNIRSMPRMKENLLVWLIVFLTIFLRNGMSRFNYEEISVQEVRPGMILSVATVISFQNSRVKGLPEYSDESTKCRLTEEQAQAVRRWGKSRYGKESVVTVKFLPFGIFMSLGTAAYLAWSLWMIG